MGWQMAARWTYLPAFCGCSCDDDYCTACGGWVAWVWNHAGQILEGVKDEKQLFAVFSLAGKSATDMHSIS